MIRGVALKTEENTMSALSDTMMTALFIDALEQMNGLVA
jgi:hypothetical protein